MGALVSGDENLGFLLDNLGHISSWGVGGALSQLGENEFHALHSAFAGLGQGRDPSQFSVVFGLWGVVIT